MNQKYLDDYIAVFEGLGASDLHSLNNVMASNIKFVDPFNNVTGIDMVKRIFEHMYVEIPDARFRVKESGHSSKSDNIGFLYWELSGKTSSRDRKIFIEGMSLITFERGLAISHIDHWDAARQFYEDLPFLGTVLAWIRKKIQVERD